ncbi:oxysterol-binding protein-related protein 8 isoform X1 [Drosophila erecta]|uniref:oxysterol-binding protein-related protein 8 isoform X1 n=1 Tax=Drosophila erecta TaxID=7220 RepID=UPI000732BF71|nr:oxysterol-binding protein-related protein 8 isoform X1 [Drosophila erecta]XP_026831923.1 oxysterol-binding protein-related protein 8 isoform X1 [Drosophila erecta]XP_026831924.1 oxysterol-binding protein-related protein 8 isoform X1 [Drosophila erecta]XP_026831925.1 oxysterol-binding protein-related protein 8 isoform X1 [Drosophila erecta]XP_026831926.1 oxysterol-binding protein-related protein 8 isoform X1 [Drosophila erecta]XP_026831927.1 oxysterol-binding protein-related protein 8 isofor
MQQPATPSTPVNNAPSAAPVAAAAAAASAAPAASAAAGASSTPIRINSARQHGAAGGGDTLVHPATPHSHSMPGTPQQQPQSSSVPTGGHLLQLQAPLPSAGAVTPSGLSMGASNQSLGVSVGAASSVSGISITPPNSAGLRQSTVFDFKFKRRPSLKVLMTKLPSTDSLSNSPAPSSPGIANWASDNRDGNLADKSAADAAKLNRKESYKAQRKNYRREKKRVASELMNSLQDPAVIVLADWLKVRGTLKSWTKLWCVLKPGLLLIYKSQKTKSSHWVGTVMLTSCQVIERPSKKDGFCFKLFHPLEQSIWAPRGPDKETIGAVVQPLPTAYLIFRAPSQAAGKCWMDALELSLRCSALLLRSNSSTGTAPTSSYMGEPLPVSHETQWSEADYEKHFNDHDLDADSQNEAPNAVMSGLESESESDPAEPAQEDGVEQQCVETSYAPFTEEEFGEQGEQVEELAEENKSLIWCIVKQVRPGMDLSKVVLPTFILEPRSFLDKLSDSYYHADLLSKAVQEDDAFTRMKLVVQWYLSSFYKKPKGLKKPYNPILGERFRCYWQHPSGSRTFYIAEQVSHHPPVSAFYVTNREDGFSITCSILAKSKFYGNSTSAVLEGAATMTLLPRGECYTATTPYAHCKGILMGTLSMELGGKINIECENTGYRTELEFKLKPFLGGADATNVVVGKIKLGKETLATINGHWDKECRVKDSKTGEETVLFKVDAETRSKRLTRYMVPLDLQEDNESQRLWQRVSEAIAREDQVAATEEKTVLEERQRADAKERVSSDSVHMPDLFELDSYGQWLYKYADLRPWDSRNDVRQYECQFKVLTQTRHKSVPIVHGVEMIHPLRSSIETLSRTKRQSPAGQPLQPGGSVVPKAKNKSLVLAPRDTNSDSSQSPQGAVKRSSSSAIKQLALAVDQVNRVLELHTRQLNEISQRLERMQYSPPPSNMSAHSVNLLGGGVSQSTVIKSLIYALIGLTFSLILRWLFK